MRDGYKHPRDVVLDGDRKVGVTYGTAPCSVRTASNATEPWFHRAKTVRHLTKYHPGTSGSLGSR